MDEDKIKAEGIREAMELEPLEVVRETQEAFFARIKYEYPDPQLAVFANHMAVQHDDNEFLISFYQLTPPLAIPGPEAMKENIERAGGIVARCVAKIAISKHRMPAIVAAMAQNVAKQQSRTEKSPAKPTDSHPQTHDSHPQEK